jgi:hypothetical protein
MSNRSKSALTSAVNREIVTIRSKRDGEERFVDWNEGRERVISSRETMH